ncbi:MAG: alanine racemase [Pseudomonadota bacterium]
MTRTTRALIDTAAVVANATRARALAPDTNVLACIKGNGYGHGLESVAAALVTHVDGFAVAFIDEAIQVRRSGNGQCDQTPVVVLEGPHHREEMTVAAQLGLTLMICSEQHVEWLEGSPPDRRPDCWLKLDTGMHRLGIQPDNAMQLYARIRTALAERTITPAASTGNTVICTHFSDADNPDPERTETQIQRLLGSTDGMHALRSCANSAGVLAHPSSHMDWVRPGYMLYGGSPLAHRSARECGLKASMSFVAPIIALREIGPGDSVGYGNRWTARRPSVIATIAAGYADGYPRLAADGTNVWIDGQLCPLAGRVSMDMLMVDVTDLPQATEGMLAELWGENISVDYVAKQAGTIGYELLAGLPDRLPRVARDSVDLQQNMQQTTQQSMIESSA